MGKGDYSAKEKVLLHMFFQRKHFEDFSRPESLTQMGMASHLQVQRPHVSMVLKDFRTEGLVEERTTHVVGHSRMKKTYVLTPYGMESAKSMLRERMDQDQTSEEEMQESILGQQDVGEMKAPAPETGENLAPTVHQDQPQPPLQQTSQSTGQIHPYPSEPLPPLTTHPAVFPAAPTYSPYQYAYPYGSIPQNVSWNAKDAAETKVGILIASIAIFFLSGLAGLLFTFSLMRGNISTIVLATATTVMIMVLFIHRRKTTSTSALAKTFSAATGFLLFYYIILYSSPASSLIPIGAVWFALGVLYLEQSLKKEWKSSALMALGVLILVISLSSPFISWLSTNLLLLWAVTGGGAFSLGYLMGELEDWRFSLPDSVLGAGLALVAVSLGALYRSSATAELLLYSTWAAAGAAMCYSRFSGEELADHLDALFTSAKLSAGGVFIILGILFFMANMVLPGTVQLAVGSLLLFMAAKEIRGASLRYMAMAVLLVLASALTIWTIF
ncbi:MAG: hypothetical protein QCI38_02525 [Candidatus Thermoplasmatota archaeon]|nr:hypothetical protein [Candidatus Thermoplasmatota archaeon]